MQKTTNDAADLQQCLSSTSPENKTTRTHAEDFQLASLVVIEQTFYGSCLTLSPNLKLGQHHDAE